MGMHDDFTDPNGRLQSGTCVCGVDRLMDFFIVVLQVRIRCHVPHWLAPCACRSMATQKPSCTRRSPFRSPARFPCQGWASLCSAPGRLVNTRAQPSMLLEATRCCVVRISSANVICWWYSHGAGWLRQLCIRRLALHCASREICCSYPKFLLPFLPLDRVRRRFCSCVRHRSMF